MRQKPFLVSEKMIILLGMLALSGCVSKQSQVALQSPPGHERAPAHASYSPPFSPDELEILFHEVPSTDMNHYRNFLEFDEDRPVPQASLQYCERSLSQGTALAGVQACFQEERTPPAPSPLSLACLAQIVRSLQIEPKAPFPLKGDSPGPVVRARLTSAASGVTREIDLHAYFAESLHLQLQRRLLAHYAFTVRSGPQAKDIQTICQSFLARQVLVRDYLRSFPIRYEPGRRPANELFFRQDFDEAEWDAIARYTYDGFQSINSALRQGKLSPAHERYLRAALAGLARAPSFRGEVARRSDLPPAVLREHHVGNVVTYTAFTSATTDLSLNRFFGSHSFIIRTRSGRAKHIDIFTRYLEGEVLFPPGSRFRVLSQKPWQNPLTSPSRPIPAGFEFLMEEVDEGGQPYPNSPLDS